MEIVSAQNSSLGFKDILASKFSLECPKLMSREQYQIEKFANPNVATPNLRPIKNKIDIPPLDGFPKPALPMRSDAMFKLDGDSKFESFHLSPNIDNRFEKLQLTMKKKNTQDDKGTIATPDVNYIVNSNYDLQSLSTLASSNKPSKCGEDIEMVYDVFEETNDCQHRIVSKSSKGPQSKERKLSNEEGSMLPPRAKNGEFLRPSKFASNTTISSKPRNKDQQALKPTSILGFLQLSCSDKLLEIPETGELEKAGTSLPTKSSNSGTMSKAGATFPAFTMG